MSNKDDEQPSFLDLFTEEHLAKLNRLKKKIADTTTETGKPKLQGTTPGPIFVDEQFNGTYTVPSQGSFQLYSFVGGPTQHTEYKPTYQNSFLPAPSAQDKPVKCECGSSVVGSPKHSDYCPLYLLQES